jgi:hypothetical protein
VKKPSLKMVESVNTEMMGSFGTAFNVSEKGNKIKYEVSRCPMYDGFRATGFSHDEVKKLCEAMAPQEYEGIKAIVPNVIGSFKFKSKPDGRCVEEFEVR